MLQAALRKQVDPRRVAQKWADHISTKADDPQTARDWVRVNIALEMEQVGKILEKIWASGHVFGQQVAKEDLGGSVGFDWSTWKPGSPAAAALVDPPRSLYTLLRQRNITLKGIADTTVDQIGSALARSLDEGLPVTQTAKAIDEVIDNPSRAMVIARTETARAQVMAAKEAYNDAGTNQWTWLVGDPVGCICVELAGQTALIGEEFLDADGNPSGITEPPAHPNCVCSVAPAASPFDVPQGEFDPASLDPAAYDEWLASQEDKAANPDTRKEFDPDQPRDEWGRWTATAGFTADPNAEAKIGQELKDRAATYDGPYAESIKSDTERGYFTQLVHEAKHFGYAYGQEALGASARAFLRLDEALNRIGDREVTLSNGKTYTYDECRDKYVVADTPTLNMNRGLRADRASSVNGLLTQMTDFATSQSSVKEPVFVTRDTRLSPDQHEMLQPGVEYTDKGFQSTQIGTGGSGYGKLRADDYPGTNLVINNIELPTGLNVANFGYGEIVLPRGTTTRIVSRSTRADGAIILWSKVIAGKGLS